LTIYIPLLYRFRGFKCSGEILVAPALKALPVSHSRHTTGRRC